MCLELIPGSKTWNLYHKHNMSGVIITINNELCVSNNNNIN